MYNVTIHFPENSGEASRDIFHFAQQVGTPNFHHSERLGSIRWAIYGYDTREEAIRLVEMVEQSGLEVGQISTIDLSTGEPLREESRP